MTSSNPQEHRDTTIIEEDGVVVVSQQRVVTTTSISNDPELKRHLAELSNLHSKKEFDRWRSSFLLRYETILGAQGGAGRAPEAYKEYRAQLQPWRRNVDLVQRDVDSGNLSPNGSTAGARARFVDFQQRTIRIAEATKSLTPATVDDEKARGYSKFQLGALLVKDGFDQYGVLAEGAAQLSHLTNQLEGVADRQALDALKLFQTNFDIFCDIMADLGLYAAMMKCHEINQLPPEPESESEEQEPEQEQEEEDDESSSSSDESEESLSPEIIRIATDPKEEPKKEEEKPKFNPYAYKVDFIGIKPPSGPYIKFVDTGAKNESQVHKGIYRRGYLSQSDDMQYTHDEHDDDDDSSSSAKHKSAPEGLNSSLGALTTEEAIVVGDSEKAYKPVKKIPIQKSNYNVGYHGGSNTEDWRISKGKVRIKGRK